MTTSPPADLQLIPDSAPFSAQQRAWLNGFFAGLLVPAAVGTAPSQPTAAPEEDYAWHDPTLPLNDRLSLAAERPLSLKLMAAMGQMDCGQCGYACKTYAQAIADGAETDLALCVPGGSATRRALKELLKSAPPAAVAPAAAARPAVPTLQARLREAVPLTGTGSSKDARHIVLEPLDAAWQHAPGDALGVHVANDPALVARVVASLGAAGTESVVLAGGERPLREALTDILDITRPSEAAIQLLAQASRDRSSQATLRRLADEGPEEGADLLELLEKFPDARPDPVAIAADLGRLQPRIYSIASSWRAHPGEIHLTVGVVRYARAGRKRTGVGSGYLSERLAPGQALDVYLKPAPAFRLPQDAAAPIILIGPGAGIAPFRAFLQERRVCGVRGRAWLYFGNPIRATDYFYAQELEEMRREGVLTRLDTAFSRDQAEKIYVQDRMRANARELWAWLEDGAYLYVCGDAGRMARDVDAALRAVVAAEGGMSAEAAADYVQRLARDKRYLRDVY